MKHKLSAKAIISLMVLATLLSVFSISALATDPTWVTKASMGIARNGFNSIVVDGKIYTIGGYDGNGYLSSMEVYNPTNNSWTTLASMSTPRCEGQTEVIDGKIYAIGGTSSSTSNTGTMERYDPTNNTWTTLPSMSTARAAFGTAVINGKIYAFGGTPHASFLNSLEVYDPTSNAWTTLAPMSVARYYCQSQVIDGKIYVFGGMNNSGYLTSTEVYDPATNTWTTRASMASPRNVFRSELIDGKIYAFGGQNASGKLSSTEVFNPANNTWTTLASMSTPRYYFQSEVAGGKIYALGGSNGSSSTNLVETYSPVTNTWTTIASLTTPRFLFQVEMVNGIIYVLGGWNGNALSSVEALVVASPPSAPSNLTATAGDTQVTLTWNSVTDATSYNVYRATTSGGPYTRITTGVAGMTYTNTGLTNGTTYYYVVTAVNAVGESVYSSEVSVTPQPSWNGLLSITMTTGENKEYALTAGQINGFITWFNSGGSASPSYAFTKNYNLGNMTSRTEYVAYSKIAFFEVMAYQTGGTPTPPSGTKTALLRVTMSTGDILEYAVTSTQLTSFTNWFSGGGASSPTFSVSKEFNLGPFISRTDYLVYDKIVDFEVLGL